MRVNIKKNIYVTLRQAQQQQQPPLKANVQKGYVNFGSDVDSDSNDDSSTSSALMNDIMGEYGNHDERQTAKEREWWEWKKTGVGGGGGGLQVVYGFSFFCNVYHT